MSQHPEKKNSQYAIACDIGGTSMRAALVERNGSIAKRSECQTDPENGFDDAIQRLSEIIADCAALVPPDEIIGIGISSAGPIEPDTGIYHHPPNLPGWHGQSLLTGLSRFAALPIHIIHDAHAAALAEARYGAAQHAKDVVYVTVSTGIGGGMISDGRPVIGEHGLAGEIGHMIIDPAGPPCNAGCRGCLEVLASGSGAAAEARRRVEAGDQTSITEFAGGNPEDIRGKHVYQAASHGDAVAGEIVETAIEALATGLSNLLATFDPGALVVGGSVVTGNTEIPGLSAHWDDLLDRVQQRALLRYRGGTPIVKSKLGEDAGLIGAAAFAYDHCQH